MTQQPTNPDASPVGAGSRRPERRGDSAPRLDDPIDEVAAKIVAAEAKGDAKKVKDLESDKASKEAFLDMAKKAQADFS